LSRYTEAENTFSDYLQVITTVSALVDILEERGLLLPVESPSTADPLDNPVGSRQKVIKELITTEREYVAALERLMVSFTKIIVLMIRNSEMNYRRRIY
jgi:hypothetical protein